MCSTSVLPSLSETSSTTASYHLVPPPSTASLEVHKAELMQRHQQETDALVSAHSAAIAMSAAATPMFTTPPHSDHPEDLSAAYAADALKHVARAEFGVMMRLPHTFAHLKRWSAVEGDLVIWTSISWDTMANVDAIAFADVPQE